MWLQTAMSPPAPRPDAAADLPVHADRSSPSSWPPSPAGLLIYWTWSNVLSILQQYVIMRRFKVDNPIDDIIARLTGKRAQAEA